MNKRRDNLTCPRDVAVAGAALTRVHCEDQRCDTDERELATAAPSCERVSLAMQAEHAQPERCATFCVKHPGTDASISLDGYYD